MRFQQIRYRCFGPFEDVVLDLSSKGRPFSLHLIQGDNEAGKSTALRGLKYFLFGFPSDVRDNFRFDPKKQRLSATLADARGTSRTFTRKRGKNNTLLDDKDRPVDESNWIECVPSISEAQFEMLFGLNHDELTGGGWKILEGRGEVGEALFMAGAGMMGLRNLRESLERSNAEIYTPRGSKQKIPLGLSDLLKKEASCQQKRLSAQQWKEGSEQHQLALQSLEQTKKHRRETELELTRMERFQAAIPTGRQLRELDERLAPFRDARIVPLSLSQEFQRVFQDRENLVAQMRVVENRIGNLKQELSATADEPRVLSREKEIENLVQEYGGIDQALRQRPDRSARLSQLRREAHDILERCFGQTREHQSDPIRLQVQQRQQILKMTTQWQTVHQEISRCENSLRQISEEMDQNKALLEDRATPAEDLSGLKSLLTEIRAEGPLEAELRKVEEQVESLHGLLQELAGQVQDCWKGEWETARRLSLPESATIQNYHRQFGELEQRQRQSSLHLNQVKEKSLKLQQELKRLEGQGKLPTEQELAQARQRRDEMIRQLSEAILQEKGKPARDVPENRSAAERVGESVRVCDTLADQMWREAKRIADRDQIALAMAEAHDDQSQCESKAREIAQEQRALEESWKRLWEPMQISPGDPGHMQTWVGRMDRLRDTLGQYNQARQNLTSLQKRIQGHQRRLRSHLPEGTDDAMSLSQLLTFTQMRLEDSDQRIKRRRDLEQRLAQQQNQLLREENQLQQARQHRETWLREWGQAVRVLNLDENCDPQTAHSYLQSYDKMVATFDEARGLQIRIEGMDRDQDHFAGQLEMVLCDLGEPIPNRPTGEELQPLVLSLRDRLNQARDLRSRRQQALGNLQREEAEHRTLESRLTKCQAQMESLRVETGAKTAEEIPQALERSTQRRQLEEARSRLRETLHQMAGASSIDDFLNEAMQQQEGLEARIAERRDALEGLNARIEELNQKVAISQQKMDEWKRATSEAALERQEIASMKEQVAQDVRTYAVQSLAQFVLHQSIDRYRKRHQGALLSRAGHYFELLTDQQFKGVDTDMDETGKPILVACRNDPEEQVEVTGLSDGTRDQLFLALRLAGIEKHLEKSTDQLGPMPLLLDDILVNFDDRRAEATFRCLGELSQKTQILLFTHHRHLADIAKKALQEGETLFLHELNNTPIS